MALSAKCKARTNAAYTDVCFDVYASLKPDSSRQPSITITRECELPTAANQGRNSTARRHQKLFFVADSLVGARIQLTMWQCFFLGKEHGH